MRASLLVVPLLVALVVGQQSCTLPSSPITKRFWLSAGASSSRILLAGGYDAGASSNLLEAVDANTGAKLVSGVALASARFLSPMVCSSGHCLIAGGQTAPGVSNAVAAVDAFSISTSGTIAAATASALLTRRTLHAATNAGSSYALFSGGRNDVTQAAVLNSIECFNVQTLAAPVSFSALAAARYSHSAAVLGPAGERVIFAGGLSSTDVALSSVECFSTTSLPTTLPDVAGVPALGVARFQMASASVGNYAFFGGGVSAVGGAGLTAVDVYYWDSTNPTQAPVSSQAYALSAGRFDLTASALGTKAIFVGGATVVGAAVTPSNVVDIFETAAATGLLNIVRTSTTVSSARYRLASAVAANTVFAAGGTSDAAGTQGADNVDTVSYISLSPAPPTTFPTQSSAGPFRPVSFSVAATGAALANSGGFGFTSTYPASSGIRMDRSTGLLVAATEDLSPAGTVVGAAAQFYVGTSAANNPTGCAIEAAAPAAKFTLQIVCPTYRDPSAAVAYVTGVPFTLSLNFTSSVGFVSAPITLLNGVWTGDAPSPLALPGLIVPPSTDKSGVLVIGAPNGLSVTGLHSYNFSFVDAKNCYGPGVVSFTLTGTCAAASINRVAPPAAAVAAPYAFTPTLQTGPGWTAPATWRVVAGGLPPGLSISAATGLISGHARQGGTYLFSLQSQDANGCPSNQQAYFIDVVDLRLGPSGTEPATQTSFSGGQIAGIGERYFLLSCHLTLSCLQWWALFLVSV